MPGQSILFHAYSPNDRSAQGNYSYQVVRRRRARALVSFNHLCDQSHISILPKYFISFTCAILHLHTPGLASWKVHDESGTAPHGRWWYSPANSLRSLSVVSIMIIAIFFFPPSLLTKAHRSHMRAKRRQQSQWAVNCGDDGDRVAF